MRLTFTLKYLWTDFIISPFLTISSYYCELPLSPWIIFHWLASYQPFTFVTLEVKYNILSHSFSSFNLFFIFNFNDWTFSCPVEDSLFCDPKTRSATVKSAFSPVFYFMSSVFAAPAEVEKPALFHDLSIFSPRKTSYLLSCFFFKLIIFHFLL